VSRLRVDAHTDAVPDDAPWTGPVVVPDDIRELQADVDAYHRELKHAARRRLFGPLTRRDAWRRVSMPFAVSFGIVTLAALVTAVLTLGERPVAGRPPSAAPVATAPAAAVGQRDGLLPALDLRTSSGRMQPARDLRPALVALVPMRCGCPDLLTGLAEQAAEVRVPLEVVAPAAVDAELSTFPGRLHYDNVVPLWDAGGVLAATYHAVGVTVLVVAPDATVRSIDRDVHQGVRLELQLFAAVTPQPDLQGRAR
jgi:hypothetical protein